VITGENSTYSWKNYNLKYGDKRFLPNVTVKYNLAMSKLHLHQ